MKLNVYNLMLIFLICMCSQAFAEGERVDAVCKVGLGNKVKAHYWHNLYVTLTNHYPHRVEALVTVIRKIEDEPTLTMKQVVTLDSGERTVPINLEFICPPVKNIIGLQYLIYVDDAKNSSKLMKIKRRYKQVERNNKKIWLEKWFVLDNKFLNVKMLASNEEQILTVNAGNNLRFIRLTVEQDDFNADNFTFAECSAADIPTNWLALSSFKLIILNNPDIKKLQFGGRDRALEDWVRAGGTLMLVLSEKVEEYKSLPIVKLSGIKLKTLEFANETARETYKLYNLKKRWNNLGASIQCIDAEVEDPDNTITSFWARNNENAQTMKHTMPIVNTRWVGAGRIVTVLMDMRNTSDSQLNGYLYKQFLQPVFVNVSGDAAFEFDEDENNYNNYYPTVDEGNSGINVQKVMGNSINNILQAKPIRFGIIALFIGIYMLVIAFVDFLLLRVMSILHWTWLSVLIWVAAFALIADRIGETFRGGEMSIREIVVADSGLGGETARCNEFAGVFSQQNQSYSVFHETENSGVTRLERLIENRNERYFRNPNQYQRNQSYDANTEFSIAQPADADEIKHPGAFIKSVILPRWVIRDIQAQSLMKCDTKKGLKIEYIDKSGFFDLLSNTYSDKAFQYSVGRDVLKDVKRIRITNNNDYPIDGLCIVYSKGKVVTFPGRIKPGKSTDLFYNIKEDLIVADNSQQIQIPTDENLGYSEYDEPAEYSEYDSYNSNDDESNENRLLFNDIFGPEAKNYQIARSFTDKNYFKIFPDSRNEMYIPKEALIVLLASGRKFMQVRTETNEETKNSLYIQNNAYDFLDISHRIESEDMVVISWSNWHIHNNTDYTADDSVDGKNVKYPADTSDSAEVIKRKKMQNYSYKYPSIKFEGWKAQTSRFIVNRIFAKPIVLCFTKN